MNVLSIYWGICSSAALWKDGAVVAATHEERFTRRKNDDGFPRNAIRACLELGGVKPEDVEIAVVASHHQDFFHQLTRPGLWSVEDYLREQKEYWLPLLRDGMDRDYRSVLSSKVDRNQYPEDYFAHSDGSNFDRDRADILADHLGIPRERALTIEHHRAHATYSHMCSPLRGRPTLALTIDAQGDGLNATVGVFESDGTYRRVHSTGNCYVARIYRYMTLLLGMKPNEHEYKVMGLAPYGREEHSRSALEVFRSTLRVEGLDFVWGVKPSDSYAWFRDRLEGVRFDSVAWGLQRWVEELLCDWTRNAIAATGIADVVVSGGVAMNIKAMGEIARLPELRSLCVGGSSSDESLAIASAHCAALDAGWTPAKDDAPLLPHLYLGPSPDRRDVLEAVESSRDVATIEQDPTPERIAALLASGRILARCSGPMEFGQRALGNRSILADPTGADVKERINAMIKNRDFWMPFAPVILDRYADRYLDNPKGIPSPSMTIGFPTTVEGYAAMKAACHPADRSARPQILDQRTNPGLYELLESFEAATGRGALLNTSFNLHGYPIVNTPAEAVDVFRRSGLDGLVLDGFLLLKKGEV